MGWYGDHKFAKFTYLCKGRRQSGQTPYWIGHRAIKKRLLSDQLFDRWSDRPNAAKALYWRMHPDEYKQANKI